MRLFITIGVCVLILPLVLFGQTAEELKNQIANQNQEIERLNKEIQAYETQLQEVGTKKQTLQSTLKTLDITRKQLSSKVSLTKNTIGSLERDIQQLSGEIGIKEDLIVKGEHGLAQAIALLHENESETFLEQLLADGSLNEVWNTLEANHTLQDALHTQINELTEVKNVLTESKKSTEDKKSSLERERRKLVSEQESLDITRREHNNLLSQTKSQESNFQKILDTKRAAKDAFEQSLNALESRLEYTMDPTRLPPAGKGILRWPLDKVTITQHFGNTEFARSGAYSGKGHNGLDFRAPVGTPIKASLAGTIEGTGNTDAVRGCYSYGKWVLIRHGNGLTTLYAHLSQINVSEGDSVKTGDTIGYAGSTGYATGPHLHFTVYASNGVKIMKLGESTGRKSPCASATIPVSPLGAYLNPLDYL